MRLKIAAALLASTILALAVAARAAQPAPAAPQGAPVRYSAQTFYETTAFGMASPDGTAFSQDGRDLLIRSDASGVFNAYAIPVAGGDPVPLTASTSSANFAESYFPNDDRLLFSADQGGNELTHLYVR